MGTYMEYLDRNLSFDELSAERKAQLARISAIRNRDVLAYAADINKGNMGAPISVDYSDILAIDDQLSALKGTALDVIIETPGGDGAVAEHIVRQLRDRYSDVAFIVPGFAKSAGTIMVMSGDEILMGRTSALGPIDAQLFWQGKVFSAEALLEGMDKIKAEVVSTGTLNKAYIPILQGISPGELQSAANALDFASQLVRDWLKKYKFKDWTHHTSSGAPVTEAEKEVRADEIARVLRSNKTWLTHSRSIMRTDLEAMRLRVTDYEEQADLADAIRRYYTLLQMTFATNVYKVFETAASQVYRLLMPQVSSPPTVAAPGGQKAAVLTVRCLKCQHETKVHAALGVARPAPDGQIPFPADNRFRCPSCGTEQDLGDARRQIEAQTGERVANDESQ